jgi:hypothetical protein
MLEPNAMPPVRSSKRVHPGRSSCR